MSVVLIAILSGFNVFFNLSQFQLLDWDESRHGVSAYEMIKSNNYIVNTYLYQNDYWNLKPILSFWPQVLGYKLFGFDALGLRFFSAFFSFLTVVSVLVFVRYKLGKLPSLISAVALLTSTPYILIHGARTGDADALFIFLFTISILSLLLSHDNIKWFYLSGLSFALAFLTKSWHSASIAIIIILFLLSTKLYKQLSIKKIGIFLLCSATPILSWIIIRYSYDGLDFFRSMIEYDLLKRTSTPLEGHNGTIFYYIKFLLNNYLYWIFLVIASILILFTSPVKKPRFLIGVLLWILIPLILFSIANTKLDWYIYPVFPAISVLIGYLSKEIVLTKNKKMIIYYLFFVMIAFVIYQKNITENLLSPTTSSSQLLLKDPSLQKYQEYKVFDYNNIVTGEAWEQSMVLASELYRDFQVMTGDFNSFVAEEDALLILPKTEENEAFIISNNLTVISSNDSNYIVKKNDTMNSDFVNKDEAVILQDNDQILYDGIGVDEIFIAKRNTGNYQIVVKFTPDTKYEKLKKYHLKFHAYMNNSDEFTNWDLNGASYFEYNGAYYLTRNVQTDILEIDQINVALYQVVNENGEDTYPNYGTELHYNNINLLE